ncbi:type II secretion system protein [Candidatus Sumerlaeota bacterium]|nr:type II secretion system protein [Candidatus Sumerlaeales bacterium]NLD61615.1 type II secretion system protein [Candidatus Sumerlaeota bacterium]
MNSVSMNNKRAMTLIELLVTMTIILIISGIGLGLMFTQMNSVNKGTTQRLDALQAARYALDECLQEYRTAWFYEEPPGKNPYFVGNCEVLDHGNRIDDDNDGLIDEEKFDGVANDIQPWKPEYNNHTVIIPEITKERRDRSQTADVGDLHLDADNLFSSATLTFRTMVDPNNVHAAGRRYVTLRVENYEGRDKVLVKTVRTYNAALQLIDTVKIPLAEKVISFAALFRDDDNYNKTWVTTWDITKQPIDDPNHVHWHIPIAVSFEITVLEGDEEPETGEIPSITLRGTANSKQALENYRAHHSNHIRNYVYPF